MLRNYLRTTWRYLLKDRQSAFLNLLGLSTGLACVLMIYLWVSDELQVDRFFANDDRLFQVMENRVQAHGIWTAPSTPGVMAEALVAEMPEVQYATCTRPANNVIVSAGEQNVRANGRYAGKDFFNIFSYPFLQGNRAQVLASKSSIVISEALALKLFGSVEKSMGRLVDFQHEEQFAVSGVFKTLPANASDQFDFVLSIELVRDSQPWFSGWGNTGTYTFLLLKPGASAASLNAKLAGYVKLKTNNEITHRTPFLKRYSDIYLYSGYENGVQTGGRISYVKLFSLIAVFILVIACINFMNLSTAKASRRLKEIGIKKAVGAGRGTLVAQYLGESVMMAFLALIVALVLVAVFLPAFNDITGKQLSLHFNAALVAAMLGITLFTGLVAGSYPALYLSGFNPVMVLKGKLNTASGELWARRGLVVFQFTLSVLLIVSVLVVYRQIRFIQTKSLGYNRDNILCFKKEGKLAEGENQAAFLAAVRAVPGVVSASSMGHSLAGHSSGTSGITWEGKDPEDNTEFENVTADYGMLETLGMQMKEGRTFSERFGADSSKLIINEAGIRFMGMKDPVGKTVRLWGKDMQIIGVVKDFHFESLHEVVKPLFIRLVPGGWGQFIVKIKAGSETATIARLQQLYERFNPGFSFDYNFLDAGYQAQYVAENRVAVLSKYFAGLAILISCLGLFGLAAFTAQKRQKEISVRKVLGATTGNVALMLSKDFLKLVMLAVLIAFPLAWWLLASWLRGFAYHVPISADVFIIAAISILVITLATISYQSVKAALANPVKSLKAE